MRPKFILFLTLSLLSHFAHASQTVHIVYSNDTAGEIEPCGCRKNPAGGYDRKAAFLKTLKGPIIQVDAGNLLFDSTTLAPLLKPQAIKRAEGVVELLNALKHDAWVPGPKDFAAGIETFNQVLSHAHFKTLAANLTRSDKKSLSWSLKPIKIKRGSFQIELLGIVDPALSWPSPLKVTSPESVLRAFTAKKSDALKAVLFHGHLENAKKLAAQFPHLTLWFTGGEEAFLQTPFTLEKSHLYQASFRNTYIGDVELDTRGNPTHHSLVELGEQWEGPPAIKEKIARIQKAIADLTPETTPSSDASHDGTPLYQTFPRCADCHRSAFQFWRSTKHASALTPLTKDHALRRLECVECHALPLDPKLGFHSLDEMAIYKDKALTIEALEKFLQKSRTPVEAQDSMASLERAWAPVQCEHCHGPGGDHPMGNTALQKPTLKGCVKCHTPHRAPLWYGKDGKLNEPFVKKKFIAVSCPKEKQ